ncbi:MAG: CoA pyrophosphatase [Clostridiales bacterium]|jgi:coenzyme A diphosphatase NUDT7|nr:CoA pyrophosphatase [Clostridiales bacterium]
MKDLRVEDFEKIFKERKPGPQGVYDCYSLLVPLVNRDGELYLLYEVRSDSLKNQPGEICFPGGRLEKGESLLECALRESCEELNICKEDIRVIAQLDYLYTYRNFIMYPFLAEIDNKALENLNVNQEEVKEVIFVPLSFLIETEPLVYNFDIILEGVENFPYEKINSDSYDWKKGKNAVPIYQYKNWTIWGLTARITYHMINILKKKYSEEVNDNTI